MGGFMAHKFGGRWTEAKLAALKGYLQAYTVALKNRSFTLLYVDAFAGSGSFVAGDGLERMGSAKIALSVPGFHRYYFIEKGVRRCNSLRQLASNHPQGKVNVIEGDANHHLATLCRDTDWKSSRAVLFLDPYGMQVDWATLEQVANTGAIDVWFLFPLSGVTRQLTLCETRMDGHKRKSLDRTFGTKSWRDSFYSLSPVPDLFGHASIERHADTEAIVQWTTNRLESIFPLLVGPTILRKGHRNNVDGGPALYALYFLASTQSRAGQAVAKRIATGVLAKLQRETQA